MTDLFAFFRTYFLAFWVLFLTFIFTLPTLFAEEVRLLVLHTNDHHGHILSTGELGGMTRLATLVKQTCRENGVLNKFGGVENTENTVPCYALLLDAGDVNTGSPESDFFRARPDFLAMNQLEYDFMTFGNHEFDPPFSKLEEQMKLIQFPMGSVNVFRPDGQLLGQSYKVFDFPGCRVGVFGVTVFNPKILSKSVGFYTVSEEVEPSRKMVQYLRETEKVDVVIAVVHLGFVLEVGADITSKMFAEAVPGIDLVVDGHSHSHIEAPVFVGKTPIVTAFEWGKILGKAEFVLEDRTVRNFTWQALPVRQDLVEDEEIKNVLAPFLTEAMKRQGRVIARTTEAFVGTTEACRTEETALGNLIADATVWAVKREGIPCDFAFVNGGTIRAGLPAGEITLGHVEGVLPFANQLGVITLDGLALQRFFDYVVSLSYGSAAYPHFSAGVELVVNEPKVDGKLPSYTVKINGQAIVATQKYRIVITDFLANGGDGYDILKQNKDTFRLATIPLTRAFLEYLSTLQQPISPKKQGRYLQCFPQDIPH